MHAEACKSRPKKMVSKKDGLLFFENKFRWRVGIREEWMKKIYFVDAQ